MLRMSERKRPDSPSVLSPNQAEDERPAKSSLLSAPTVSFGERPMLDYQADSGELATACEPNDSACVPQHTTGIRQDECSDWDNYALFVFEQQGRYSLGELGVPTTSLMAWDRS